jgi:hypothetical protein
VPDNDSFSEGVFFQDNSFGGGVGGHVTTDARVGADFPKGGGVAFAITVPNEADYGV